MMLCTTLPSSSMSDGTCLRTKDARLLFSHGEEIVWCSPAKIGFDSVQSGISDHNSISVPTTQEYSENENNVFIKSPLTEWTPDANKRFKELVRESALGIITPADRQELHYLQTIRRSNTPGRSYEDIVRSAELAKRLKVLKEALADYVKFLNT